ncbi:MAG: DUF72 domain-containing protein [Pseudomonadota bacterium]
MSGASEKRIPVISLGAWGWEHAEWVGTFYPDDLPPEWRLTFYSNEFDAVGLYAAGWMTPPVAALEQWLEDTHADFRFHLVMPSMVLKGDEDVFSDIAERLNLLRPRLGSILLSVASATCLSMLGLFAPAEAPLYGLHAGRLVPQAMPDFHAVMDPATAPLIVLGEEAEASSPAATRSQQRALRAAMDALALRGRSTILVNDAPLRMLQRLESMRSMRALLGLQ